MPCTASRVPPFTATCARARARTRARSAAFSRVCDDTSAYMGYFTKFAWHARAFKAAEYRFHPNFQRVS